MRRDRVTALQSSGRIYGVFALDCVIQMLLLLTGSVFREFKGVSREQLRHLTEEMPDAGPKTA